MTTLLLIITLPVLAALQARLPTAWWLGGLRFEFLPALVVYAALTLRRGPAIAFAFAAGLIQDSLSAGPIGLHASVYATITALLTGMNDVLDRELPWMQMGAGAITTGVASLLAICITGISFGAILKLLILAVISAVITPVLFLGLDALRYFLGREAR